MLLSVAAALVLSAQPSSPWLDEARALVEQLRFGDAIARLEVARQVRGLDPAELREVLELLAYCEVAEGRREAAEATYTVMLQMDPWMELSSSPKVLEAFVAAKRRLFPLDYGRLEERPSPAGWATFTLVDPWSQVRAVTLFERRDGGAWTETVLTGESGHTWRFPLRLSGDGRLEWYLEANGDTVMVAHVGSRAAPRVLEVVRPVSVSVPAPAKEGRQGLRLAGFVTIGAGVALAAVATGLALGGTELRQAARNPSRPPGDYADTASAAEREGQTQQTWARGLFIGAGAAVVTGVVLAW